MMKWPRFAVSGENKPFSRRLRPKLQEYLRSNSVKEIVSKGASIYYVTDFWHFLTSPLPPLVTKYKLKSYLIDLKLYPHKVLV